MSQTYLCYAMTKRKSRHYSNEFGIADKRDSKTESLETPLMHFSIGTWDTAANAPDSALSPLVDLKSPMQS